MKTIKLLDCTLRDGGYINDWVFGRKAIKDIKEDIELAGIDIIELGFIRNEPFNENRTVFNSISQVKKVLDGKKLSSRQYAVMAEVSNPYPLDMLEPYDEESPEIIRVIVWKRMLKEGFEYCKGIVEKGYKLCVQPARVSQYSDEEFVDMIKMFNELNPMAIYVVDSWGTMYKDELLHYLKLADENLNDGISVGYHGHNNMMQAFDVAQAFCEYDLKRDLIIDASVYGIGRGAGNLNTEIFAKWANEKLGKNYNTTPLIKIFDKYIKEIYKKEQWGFSIPYLITAKYNANPNFASFYEKNGLSGSDIEKSIAAIPEEERIIFKPEVAKKYASVKIYDNKLAVIIPTKDRPRNIVGFINDYVVNYYKNNIDVIVYDSSEKDFTEKIVKKYGQKYPNIKYARYEADPNCKSIDAKYISIIENYAEQYKYLWITRDGLAINIPEVMRQINYYLDNNYELLVLDVMERDQFKLLQKEYDSITDLFKENLFQMSVLGSSIVRSDILKKMVEQVPLDDKKNYGMYWPIAYFDCFANSKIKAIKLILTIWHANFGASSGSFWHKKFLWQFGERWYESIMSLPDVYNPYKENALHFKLVDCEPFSALFMLNVKKKGSLNIFHFIKNRKYIKEVSSIPMWKTFLIFLLPYFLLMPVRKFLKLRLSKQKRRYNKKLVNNFLDNKIEEGDICLYNSRSF